MNTDPTQQTVLVVSDSATEIALLKSMLESDFPRVSASSDPDSASTLFLKSQASVLLLAFRDLRKAELFYLGIYRHGGKEKFEVHPHRAIMLCSKDDVRTAYDLCRSGLVDDYVQFWPMTYDAPRLAMSVHRSLQECMVHAGSSHSAAAFAVQARQLAQFEELLGKSLQAGAGYAAATGEAVVKAEADIGHALDSLAAHMLQGGSVTLASGSDVDAVARQVADFSADAVLPHLREVSSAIEPLSAWIESVTDAMEPHIKSTRALLDMASQVSPCVLIVDDDEFQRQISGRILESEGYQVKYAGNGGEALSTLSKMRPDLILMDLLMPDMTGLEVIERIKSEPTLAVVPVIMITGKAERDVVLGSIRVGAADFIAKPVDRKTLLDKVASLVAPGKQKQPDSLIE